MIVVSLILIVAIGFSLINISTYGIGVKFEKAEILESVLKEGDSTVILVNIRNHEPEKIGMVKIKTFLTNPDDSKYIEIQDYELTTRQVAKRSLTSDFSIKIKVIESNEKEYLCTSHDIHFSAST